MTADRRSAVLRGAVRGGPVIVITGCGLALSSAAYLWRGTTSGAVLLIVGTMAAMAALVRLYATRRPLRFAGVPLGFGVVALFVFGIVGVTAARDVAMTLVGVDADAVVARTWTTAARGGETYHCTLRRTDGTPIPRELATGCEGHERGDTISVVLDPDGRFAPVSGPKSDLPVVGQLQVAAAAALVLLTSIAIGSGPRRPKPTSRPT